MMLAGGKHCKGRLHEKKVAVLLDFVQMRGGRALPKFFGTLVLKEVVHVVLIRGRGGGVEVIWTKSKRISIFFREAFPY